MKIRIKLRDRHEREVRLFGLPICQYGWREVNGERETYFNLFPKSFKHRTLDTFLKSFEREFLDKVIEIVGINHDLVFLLRANGNGEAYLASLFIDELIQKYNAKNPCMAFHRKVFEDIFNVFNKKIPLYHTSNLLYKDYNDCLATRDIIYKGIRFYVLQCTFSEVKKLTSSYANGGGDPYPVAIKKINGIGSYQKIRPQFSEGDRSVVNIIKDINLARFVFLIPEANCMNMLSDNFWEKLSKKFKEKNLDVFVNTKSGACNFGKSADISISQAMYLASLSRGIIAARSGFSELVSMFPIHKHIIYAHSKYGSIAPRNMIKAYSLSNYPMVGRNTLFEYDIEESSEETIIEKIMKEF